LARMRKRSLYIRETCFSPGKAHWGRASLGPARPVAAAASCHPFPLSLSLSLLPSRQSRKGHRQGHFPHRQLLRIASSCASPALAHRQLLRIATSCASPPLAHRHLLRIAEGAFSVFEDPLSSVHSVYLSAGLSLSPSPPPSLTRPLALGDLSPEVRVVVLGGLELGESKREQNQNQA
jgi:hypothetical protein